MATKDAASGLLAKVGNFVRRPPSGPEFQDKASTEEGGENTKLSMTRMIERKAHNDMVRKREFFQLRQLREASPASVSELAELTSFFSDSLGDSSFDDRTTTLKKIDEIEAQMSKQWWKNRQSTAPAAEKGRPEPVKHLPANASESGRDTWATFANTVRSDLIEDASGLTTQVGVGFDQGSQQLVATAAQHATAREIDSLNALGLAGSVRTSISKDQALSDVVLEAAAIRFANSDDAGAAAVLLAALARNDATQQSSQAWAQALLDLYRGTGQQASFDRAAVDYTVRFQRAAPGWFSTPEALRRNPLSTQEDSPASLDRQGLWVCQAVLDDSSVVQLKTRVTQECERVKMDWHLLKSITPAAGQMLAVLLADWCEMPLKLQCAGLQVLQEVLQRITQVGDKQVEQFWWHSRMNVARMLVLPKLFDLVAMDFCITYEISPPPWKIARCQLIASPRVSCSDSVESTDRSIELLGEVLGTVTDSLASFQAAALSNGPVQVNCDRLIRVDFSAAGSILNWAASLQASNRQVQLLHVPRLVAVFLILIGMNEYAQVTVRDN